MNESVEITDNQDWDSPVTVLIGKVAVEAYDSRIGESRAWVWGSDERKKKNNETVTTQFLVTFSNKGYPIEF